MDEISKKDLLATTGISYGQLYRWKREGLIPEEWFVKKSAFTGQETYFPREQILARIEAILSLKDTTSLEDIRISLEQSERPLLKGTVLDLMLQHQGGALVGPHDFSEREASLSAWSLVAGILEAGREAAVPDAQLGLLVEEALAQVSVGGAAGVGFATQVSIVVAKGTYHFITATSATALAADSLLTIHPAKQLQVYRDRVSATSNTYL